MQFQFLDSSIHLGRKRNVFLLQELRIPNKPKSIKRHMQIAKPQIKPQVYLAPKKIETNPKKIMIFKLIFPPSVILLPKKVETNPRFLWFLNQFPPSLILDRQCTLRLHIYPLPLSDLTQINRRCICRSTDSDFLEFPRNRGEEGGWPSFLLPGGR